MKIRIHSEQSELNKFLSILKKLCRRVCTQLKLDIATLDIIFIDKAEFQKLHLDYLRDGSTGDVLTFNLADGNQIEGEIYINLEQTRKQARFYRVTLLDEISRMIIHGCLHLAGFSDLYPAGQKTMKRKEEFLLAQNRKYFHLNN
jgi:rRNA maturation RNase YbeY